MFGKFLDYVLVMIVKTMRILGAVYTDEFTDTRFARVGDLAIVSSASPTKTLMQTRLVADVWAGTEGKFDASKFTADHLIAKTGTT